MAYFAQAKGRNATALRGTLITPSDRSSDGTRDISGAMNAILADTLALYVKTKNFHGHLSGPHFRDYHLLFDEQANQIFAMTDSMAERVRKVGGATLRSIETEQRTWFLYEATRRSDSAGR